MADTVASISTFQSPLHRGSLFNSQHFGLTVGDQDLLSVPSSSGKTLQQAKFRGLVAACNSFSPLFIGEGSSTMAHGGWAVFPHPNFQSPLHRGRLFNPYMPVSDGYHSHFLSVPSSSGKTLQQHGKLLQTAAQAPFSPLFIGEGSSTSEPAVVASATRLFQSPLHRGRLFNRIDAASQRSGT